MQKRLRKNDEEKIREKLTKIKKLGFVKTHRTGPTGIGKTLEDLSGIPENNIAGPDDILFELKAGRANSSSMLTLFTKSPLPKKANSILLERFGYVARENGKKELHTTVLATQFNNLRGKPGFRIAVEKEKIALISVEGEELGYWDKETLKVRFEKKYPGLLYVKAEAKGKGKNEQFWFCEAWFLWGFDFENFVELIKQDIIKTDVRIGQYADGSPHDHGTGFRVMPARLDECFKHRKKII